VSGGVALNQTAHKTGHRTRDGQWYGVRSLIGLTSPARCVLRVAGSFLAESRAARFNGSGAMTRIKRFVDGYLDLTAILGFVVLVLLMRVVLDSRQT
jgi:hypothetical protein